MMNKTLGLFIGMFRFFITIYIYWYDAAQGQFYSEYSWFEFQVYRSPDWLLNLG